ncbi:MAG: response regulator [Pyrinomonadaceae bacterium]
MSEGPKTKILLVDDRPENLLVMRSVLGDDKYDLICVSSGREALKALLNHEVALILLDVQMPGLNGFELAELIRERESTQNTPIIFVSAESVDEHYIFQGYSLGAVDYLTKPVNPEILKSKVGFFARLFQQNQEIKRQAGLLEDANTRLDQLNGELEIRVRTRTAELEASNIKLAEQVESRKLSEARLAIEHSITRSLAHAEGIESAANEILDAFWRHLNSDYSAFWILNDAGTELVCVGARSNDKSGLLQPLVNASLTSNFRRGVGLPGHVWNENGTIWHSGTYEGEQYPGAAIATAARVHTAVGFPIMIGDEFFGVIELFTRKHLGDKPSLLNMFFAIGSEIGQFVRRKRIEGERKNLLQREKALRRQAEKANRMKDEFLATVSHELRTPLNSILGWGQILNTGGLSDDEQSNALNAIFRNAKSQSQLIDDLLDTSRLIGGNVHLELSPTDIIPLIEAAIEVVRPAAGAKNIKLSAKYLSTFSTITCDSQRLQQMVWNLLTNAVKFTSSGGEVGVVFARSSHGAEIVVTDTGCGIAPEFVPHVFDRFRQADSSSTRTHDGLGLGLAIVRHLAELHGGTVSVTSDGLGHGSTFTISMPAAALAAAVPEQMPMMTTASPNSATSANGHRLDGIKVLIVDDDLDAVAMLKFALNSSGADVRTSGSVPEAFESISQTIPDVLLADINMPGQDGYSLIRELRSRTTEDGADIPAIALTAMARTEDSELALASGFQMHISKPVNIDEIAHAVARLAGKNGHDA